MPVTQFDIARFNLLSLVIWSRVFWPSVKSTALEQKRFDLQSLSPALRNLWLLLVIIITIWLVTFYYQLVEV